MTIYISNLSSTVNDENLKALFAGYGEVKSAEVMMDLFTDKSRGFGYVEIEDEVAANQAIQALNNTELQNLTISVKETPRRDVRAGSYKVGSGPVTFMRPRRR